MAIKSLWRSCLCMPQSSTALMIIQLGTEFATLVEFEPFFLNSSLDVFRVVMRGSIFLTGLIVLPVFACADKGDYTVS